MRCPNRSVLIGQYLAVGWLVATERFHLDRAGVRRTEESRNSFTTADADRVKRRTGYRKWAGRAPEVGGQSAGSAGRPRVQSEVLAATPTARGAPPSGRGRQTLVSYAMRDRGRPPESTSAGKFSPGVHVGRRSSRGPPRLEFLTPKNLARSLDTNINMLKSSLFLQISQKV